MWLRRVLFVLVPSAMVLVTTAAAPRLYNSQALPPVALAWLTFGLPPFLVAVTAWASARFGQMGLRGSAVSGAMVFVLGLVVPLAALAVVLWMNGRDDGDWELGQFFGGVAISTLLALLIGLGGGWIGIRMRPRAT